MSDEVVPLTVLGREIPEQFRHAPADDTAGALMAFIEWLEDQLGVSVAPAPPPMDAMTERPRAGVAAQRKRAAEEKAVAEAVAEERARLVELCVDLHDWLPGEGLRDRVMHTLEQAGVDLVTGEGEPFDPLVHEAAGETPTTDDELDSRVASTQRVGYRDRGRLVREPVVLVYRLEGRDG